MKKKMFKRAGVAVLSMAMLLSMGAVGGISASAANGTVTVSSSTNLKDGDTVTFYKVGQTNAQTGDWEWCNGLTDTNVGTAMSAVEAYTEASNAAQLKALASKLERMVKDTTTGHPYSGSAESSTATVNGTTASLAPAYYLGIVTSTDNSMTVAPILVAVTDSSTPTVATVKSSPVSIDKEIRSVTDGTTADDHESADVSKDSIITYSISADIPSYDSAVGALDTSYLITDTATNLTLGSISRVYIDKNSNTTYDSGDTLLELSTGYTMPTATSGQLFNVQLNDSVTLGNGGEKVVVEFTASLTDGAYNVMNNANTNTATLTYANEYATGGGSKSISDDAKVYTAVLKLNKLITGDETTAQAFSFTLQKHDGSDYADYRTGISVTSNGAAVELSGLPTGQYKLIETDVAGYKPLTPITFEITDTAVNGTFAIAAGASAGVAMFDNNNDGVNDWVKVTATNTKIDALPGTGGMGTVMFTVGGAAIVLCAGFMFVIYMRKRRAEEE